MTSSHPVRYALETAATYMAYGFFRLLPLDAASDLGGWVGRTFGPGFGATKTARGNLAMAFPEKSEAEREEIIRGMWDNLGRTAAEYAHLRRMWERVELQGEEQLIRIRDSGAPAIFCGAHLANWEVSALAAKKYDIDVHLVYRKPNNPGVDGLLRHARDSGAAAHIEKGREGARDILSALKKNGAVALMIDQKLNEGIPVPFFGRAAMTAPALAHFAWHFDCPVYPVRIERLKGCRFKMTVYPPLAVPRTDDKEQDVRVMMTEATRMIEGWIRERPAQWLWIHRRWPD